MSEITEVKAVLEAEDRASAVVKGLRAQVDKLAKSFASLSTLKAPNLKTTIAPAGADVVARSLARTEAAAMGAMRARFSFQSRMGRQRAAEERAIEHERRAVEAATMRDMREKVAFATRMNRQRVAELRGVDRERQRTDAAAERDAAAAQRRRVADTRYLFSLRQRQERQEQQQSDRARRNLVGSGRDAWGRSRDAVRDVVRPAGVAAIAGTAATGAAARRILGAESKVDAAEINTRSYGGLSADAARALRDRWAAPLAEQLGAQTDKLLTAWTDAVKLGVPAAGAKSFSELSTKTSEAWEVPFEQVTDIFGTINTLLTSKGEAFDIKRLQSVANSIQHLAAKQSTTPERLVSFLQRGAGAAQVLGMSQEAGLAFGSASTSLGNQAGQSGRMFDYVASRLIEMPRLVKQHGQEGEQARKLVQALGYGSAEAMDRKRRADPDSFLPEFLSRFNKIRNPKQQDQAIRFFTGREWLGEFGRMVKGIDTYKEAVKLAKEAKGLDAIGAVWELHRMKLTFVFKQFRSGWLNILGEFGKVLSPMARQAGDVFLKWAEQLRAGGLAARFRASLEGFVNGLGFKDLPALLKGLFGEPGQGAAGAIESWRAAARGFGAGVRDVVDLVVGSLRRLSGNTGDPEVMARWTARLLTFSAAMVIAGPAITALGGISSAIVALGTAAAATWTALKVGALVSGPAAAGAGAGAGAAVALRAVVGRLLGGVGLAIGAELGARRGEIVTALLGAMRGVWGDFVAALKADFAEWSKDGILRGVLRALDPNLKVDPPRVDGKVKPEPDADVPAWKQALDWLRGTDRTKTSESGDPKPSSRPTPAPAWRDPPRKSEPAGINVLDAIKGALAPKVPTVELPDAGPTVVPTITVPRPEVPAPLVPRIPNAARPPAPPVAPPAPALSRIALTVPQLMTPRPSENGNLDLGPVIRAIGSMSPVDVLRAIAGTCAAILSELRRRSRRAVDQQDSEREGAAGHFRASFLRGDAVEAVDRLGRTISADGARLQLAALTAPSRAALAGFSGTDGTGTGGSGFNAAGPGGPGDPAKAFGRNFFTPGSGSPRSPSWFGTTPSMGQTGNPASMPGPAGPIGDRMKSVYQAYRNAGLSHEAAKSFAAEIGRENGYRETLLFGKHTDPHNGKLNAGMMSWQGDRATKMLEFLREQGQLSADGSIKKTQEALNAQAQFSLEEMQSGALGARGQRALGVLNNPNASHADRALALGDDVIKWRQHDPTYAHHKGIRDRYYAQLGGLTDSNAGRTASTDPSAGVGGQGAGIPGLARDGAGQFDGLKVKGAQATGGGATHVGVTDLARQAQADLPGGVKHFAAFNDHYHAGTRSKHASGLAFDTSLLDPSKSREAAEAMRSKMRAAGLTEDAFKVIDEYKNPSARSTAGHIHTQFNSAEAAKKYQDYIASLRPGASPVAQAAAAALSPSDQAMAAVTPPKNAAKALTPSDKAANAVDVAQSFEGMDEDKDHAKLSKFMGHEVRGDINAWCARFVNSSLNAAGIKNAGSPVASSYLKWGQEVADKSKIAKGDVLVEDHRDDKSTPFKPGMTGGHAGLATGKTRMEDGKLMLEMVSGNHDNSVKTSWVGADEVKARRAPGAQLAPSAVAQGVVDGFKATGWKPSGPSAAAAAPSAPAKAAVDGFTSSGWKPSAPAGATAPSAEAARAGIAPSARATAGAARAMAPNASTLAREAAPSAQDLAKSVPAPEQRAGLQGGSGGAVGGGGHTFSAPITIHAGNQSPQELAGHLQRSITEGWNLRAHDLEPELT